MNFQVPTAGLSLAVRKTVRQLNEDGTVDIDVICRWDGQDVTLICDPSPETDIDRTFLARLDVGDRVLVKGRMTVQQIPDNTSAALHVSLFVQTAENPDKSYSPKFGSSKESGGDKSSSHNGSSSDSGSNSDSGSSSNNGTSRDNESCKDRSESVHPHKSGGSKPKE